MTRFPQTNGLPDVLLQLLLCAVFFFTAQMVHACPMHEGHSVAPTPAASAEAANATSTVAVPSETSAVKEAAPTVFMSQATPMEKCDRFHLCCVTPAALPPHTNVLAVTMATHEAPLMAPEAPSNPLLPQPTPPPIA